MGRIMGIDYGLKRTGLSVTDPMKIIVQGLETQKTDDLMSFIKSYSGKEHIDAFVVGYPFLEGSWGDKLFKEKLDGFIADLKKVFPTIEVKLYDERNTSVRAKEIILQSGVNRKKRQNKELMDRTSAIVILQEYLGHI
ncbi:MAG TPA: Holliday junction resolvase RuvX [Saprospiraceae bacterium]|nr:Holliday junction resolvase RuvX [Saprospiraceae bacterium]